MMSISSKQKLELRLRRMVDKEEIADPGLTELAELSGSLSIFADSSIATII